MTADPLAVSDRARCLEAGDRPRDKLAELVRVDGRLGAKLNDPHDLLAETLARSPDHERVDDVGVPAQHLFDLFDEDLLSAAVHDQRVAPEQYDAAIRCEARPIARDSDALAVDDRKRLLGLLPIAEVAERHAPAPRGPADLVFARHEESTPIRGEDQGSGARCEVMRPGGAPRRTVGHPARLRGAVSVDNRDV